MHVKERVLKNLARSALAFVLSAAMVQAQGISAYAEEELDILIAPAPISPNPFAGQAYLSDVNSSQTPDSIYLEGVEGQEYIIVKKDAEVTEASWNNALVPDAEYGYVSFENLTPATIYEIYTRVAALGDEPAGTPVKLEICTSLSSYGFSAASTYVGDSVTIETEPESETLTYQWFWDFGVQIDEYTYERNYVAIPGETSATHVLTRNDIGRKMAVIIYQGSYEVGDMDLDIDVTWDPDKPIPEPEEELVPKNIPVYRLFNIETNEHFFTASEQELSTLEAAGWILEGKAWYTSEKTDTPVYRLFDAGRTGKHIFTASTSEKEAYVSDGWTYEGIAWYAEETKETPVYRLVHPSKKEITHLTAKKAELEVLTGMGWTAEETGFYVK